MHTSVPEYLHLSEPGVLEVLLQHGVVGQGEFAGGLVVLGGHGGEPLGRPLGTVHLEPQAKQHQRS